MMLVLPANIQVPFGALLLALLWPPSNGFICPSPRTSMSMDFSLHHKSLHRTLSPLPASRIDEYLSRSDFLRVLIALAPGAGVANAFDGGVGGKTRPQTGVVFRDPEAAAETTQSSSGDVTYELVAPDETTPVLVSFSAPWPLLKSAAGVEARDMSGGESSFVQVVELPKGITTLDDIKPALLSQNIFGSTGKFGMYGVPTDIKIKKISQTAGAAIYQAMFTTLTPAMRESDRKAYISAAVVGGGLFLLVTTTTSVRFGKLEQVMRKVADSFTVIPAPKSSFNQRKSS